MVKVLYAFLFCFLIRAQEINISPKRFGENFLSQSLSFRLISKELDKTPSIDSKITLFKKTTLLGYESKSHSISFILKMKNKVKKPMQTFGIVEYAFLMPTPMPINVVIGAITSGKFYVELDMSI